MGTDITCYTEVRKEGVWKCVHEDWPFVERNYNLFYFVGYQHEGLRYLPQLAEPRGLPPDLSAKVREEIDNWDQNNVFYQSWLTLAELLNYDYNQIVYQMSVIAVIEPGDTKPSYYPAPEGEGTVKDFSVKDEIDKGDYMLDRLRRLQAELGEPENVRVVFWFDQP